MVQTRLKFYLNYNISINKNIFYILTFLNYSNIKKSKTKNKFYFNNNYKINNQKSNIFNKKIKVIKIFKNPVINNIIKF